MSLEKRITLRLPAKLVEELRREAKADDRTLSKHIRRLLLQRNARKTRKTKR